MAQENFEPQVATVKNGLLAVAQQICVIERAADLMRGERWLSWMDMSGSRPQLALDRVNIVGATTGKLIIHKATLEVVDEGIAVGVQRDANGDLNDDDWAKDILNIFVKHYLTPRHISLKSLYGSFVTLESDGKTDQDGTRLSWLRNEAEIDKAQDYWEQAHASGE